MAGCRNCKGRRSEAEPAAHGHILSSNPSLLPSVVRSCDFTVDSPGAEPGVAGPREQKWILPRSRDPAASRGRVAAGSSAGLAGWIRARPEEVPGRGCPRLGPGGVGRAGKGGLEGRRGLQVLALGWVRSARVAWGRALGSRPPATDRLCGSGRSRPLGPQFPYRVDQGAD